MQGKVFSTAGYKWVLMIKFNDSFRGYSYEVRRGDQSVYNARQPCGVWGENRTGEKWSPKAIFLPGPETITFCTVCVVQPEINDIEVW